MLTRAAIPLSLICLVSFPVSVEAWNNGPSGNASTDLESECASPPYSTHDWVADHALDLLPDDERAWLAPFKTFYLLGTEAPDNDDIPEACGAPNTGYDDRRKGHSIEWSEDWSNFKDGRNRAAMRAQEEYDKAGRAFESGDISAAAYYLGAMAHYIGDVAQYGHTIPSEAHHSDYEGWVSRRTDSFAEGNFESYLQLDSLVRRRAYTAVKRISKATARGKGNVLSAVAMDASYSNKNQTYKDSVGASLNIGVNELTDVLHTFYLNVVDEEGS